MTKGFQRTVGFLLLLCVVLMLNITAVHAAGIAENGSGTGTTFTFTMEETSSGNSENTSEPQTGEMEKTSSGNSENMPEPQTGETSNLALWFALLFVSGGAAICTTIVRRKKYNR